MKLVPKFARERFVRFAAARSQSCLTITKRMSESLDRQLTLRERYSVWLHSLICDACVRYLEQIAFIRDAVRAGDPTTDLSNDGLSDRTKNSIKEAVQRARQS